MSNNFTEYNLSTDAYAAFDAVSLKRLIVDRLSEDDVFTDQIFEGSNLSSMIDVIAYSYHVLLFYLNRTSNESMFSQAQLYENMNRVVKLLNYKPMGTQTSVVPFTMTAEKTMSRGIYTIPRYSYIDADGIKFSINTDITYSKLTDLIETLTSVGENNVLYQGQYVEYPRQIATGEPFEIFTITLPRDVIIDHNSIDVYVYKKRGQKYIQYAEVESLYFAKPDDISYEKRFNENGRFELKFGNDVNGVSLDPGDEVYIMYLQSKGDSGKVAANVLDGKALTLYTSVKFQQIRDDVKPDNVRYISFNDAAKLKFSNSVGSTTPASPEGVETIRQYAPEFFQTQNL